MIPTAEDQEVLGHLEPPNPYWGGMGALRLRPDSRDYPALWHPGFRAVATAEAAQDQDWTDKVCALTNQGATGACVVHSTCSGIQVNEEISSNVCYRFNPQAFYTELGGTGSNGIDSRVCLQKCVDTGAPVANSNQRVRVGSYFFIDQNPGTFADAIKTALTAKKSVVIALLLPSSFGGKWTGGNPTTGYHQLCIVGTKGDLFWGPNSWGENWGGGPHPAGFYELSFEYVTASNFQNRYCYAYFFDAIATDTGPPPPVNQTWLVAGKALGTGTLSTSQAYTLTGAGANFTVALDTAQKVDGGPGPGPGPGQITVTGYTPNPVGSGQSFTINGSGFQGGNLTVSWRGQSLTAQRLGDTQIQATAPPVTTSASGPVIVQVEAVSAAGPPLIVTAGDPGPGPGPGPGDLKVTVQARRYSRGIVGIWVWVQEPGSADVQVAGLPDVPIPEPPALVTAANPEAGYVAATVACRIVNGGQSIALEARQTGANGTPATWQVPGAPPAPATVTAYATTSDGRQGQGQTTV